VFVGVLGSWQSAGLGGGLWGGRLLYGPALPFALGLFGGAGVAQRPEGRRLIGTLSLSLYLPLVRRFALGFSPATLQLACTTDFGDCAAEGQATVGSVIVRLGPTWLAVQGPTWSWDGREFRDSQIAVALAWWHERHPDEAPLGHAPPAWQPPAAGAVTGYRQNRTTTLAYLTATVASTAQDQAVGAGLEAMVDRDRWNRRAGLGPGLGLEYARGKIDGRTSSVFSLAALARLYVVPNQVALVVAPAVLRVRTAASLDAVDVGGRLGLVLVMAGIELRADSPALSYRASDHWHGRPFSMGLALVLR
jgi:hypothetical protein